MERSALAVVVAVTLLLGLLAWSPAAPGVWHDDGVYLLLGKALAAGDGLHYAGVSGSPPAPKFPPLYPLVLAAVWRSFPGFPENSEAFQLLNVCFQVLAATAFAWFARRSLGFGARTASVFALITWTSLHLWRVTAVPLSEPLFIATLGLSLAASVALEKRESGAPGVAIFFLAAAAASHTRTAGLVLWPAAVLAAAWAGSRRKALVAAACALSLSLPWLLWGGRAARRITPGLQDILGPYGGWLFREMSHQPALFARRIPQSLLGLSDGVVSLVLPGVDAGPRQVLAVPASLILAVGCVALWRKSRFAVLTPAFYLAVLLIWPYRETRLLTPLLPFLALAVFSGFRTLLRLGGPRWFFRTAVLSAAVAWGAWFGLRSIGGLVRGEHDASYRIRSAALLRAVEAVENATPPEAVVGAPELWAAIHLYTGRTVAPSAPFAPISSEGPAWGTPEAQFRLWEEAGLDYLLVEHGGAVHKAPLDRLDELCPGSVKLVASMTGAALVRLDWDAECRRTILGH